MSRIQKIQNGTLVVEVSEEGAELQSLRLREGTELLWQGDPEFWSGRAPVLFPFVARLTEGRYSMDGRIREMPIHGFASGSSFHAVENTGRRLTLQMEDSGETLRMYPRRFAFRVIFELRGPVLAVTYEVENRDAVPMRFGLGGHPGFNVPLEPGSKFEDWRLRFSSPCSPVRIGFTPACFLSGENVPFPLEDGCILPLRHEMFDRDAVVLAGTCRQVSLESPASRLRVTVSFPEMPFLGIWHVPGREAPYVCIEPWLSLPAEEGKLTVFEERQDLAQAAPGETYRNTWTIAAGIREQ